MIVFNLICPEDHAFEGWFASTEAFERQHENGLLSCPMCGNANIRKALNAPRLNLAQATQATPAETDQAYLGNHSDLLVQFRQFILSNTENVGPAFAETARRMHYGEEAHRNIRGKVSPEDAAELAEEGIHAVGLPAELLLDEPLQ
jgi:hypothetical protein